MTCAALALLLATQTSPPVMSPDLWQHLRGWEAAMTGVTSLVSKQGTKTVTSGAGVTTTYDVEAWFLKPDRLRLRLDRRPAAGQKPDPNDYATYICTPGSVFEYDGPSRTATEYPAWMTEWAGEHPLLAVLSGRLTARQLATR